jgi:hypothetical protein
VAVLGGAVLVAASLAAPAAHAALGSPAGLAESPRNATTHVLSWAPVAQATSYEVQVDDSSAFDSPNFTATTVNTQLVPTKVLPAGDLFWRVRSVSGSTRSAWSEGDYTQDTISAPVPLSPTGGQALDQPQDPPLLQWSAVQGATSYTVQVDGDADMIGAKSYSTKSTSLVVPDPLTAGDWYWTVTASKGTGLNSLPSDVADFVVNGLPAPQITYPVDDINQTLEDVVFDWTPVPGAKTYDLQVALDADFNNIALTATGIESTRYSPATTLNSDQFWWRVRAVDPAGQQSAWTSSLNGFKRVWPEAPQALYPLGSTASPAAISGTKAFYQWTPVPHATEYQLQVSTDPNFSPGATSTCKTAQTTYTPTDFRSPECPFPSGSTVYYWRVRPLDLPYNSNGLPGIFSTPQAFSYTPPTAPVGAWDPSAQVAGLKVAVGGLGIADAGKGCSGDSPDNPCQDMPTTPVLSWDPVPGAALYLVYYAQDANFTTSEIPSPIKTRNTIFQLSTLNTLSSLPDSQAGAAYYWHVRACADVNLTQCGPDPVSSASVLPDTRSFTKVSPPVQNLTSSNPNASEITFSWQDYYDTNVGTTVDGETSTQTAKTYRIQVDNDSTFASPIDTQTVDQTTYTEHSKLYADGTYWWRVQAVDDENQGGTWSTPQSFTKVSPQVTQVSPVGGAHVSGMTPFRWDAAPFAASYTLEVYKNNDLTFSAANRAVSASVKTTAYTPATPLPADGTNYVWRVRRVDASGNPGPWSATGVFYSTGDAATLVQPDDGIWASAKHSLFEWTEVPGAASYQLVFGGASTSKFTTVATAYAPTATLRDGAYSWKVVALDSGGHSLGASETRDFSVDGTPPKVVSILPKTLRPKSNITAAFSEPVTGVTASTMKLYKVVKRKRILISATVRMSQGGTVATVNPKSLLRAGSYVVVFTASRIKDQAGNTLVPSSAARALKTGLVTRTWTG